MPALIWEKRASRLVVQTLRIQTEFSSSQTFAEQSDSEGSVLG